MTLDQMLSLLATYLNDPGQGIYTPEQKLLFLNLGQDKALGFLHRHLVSELDEMEDANALDSDGSFDLDDLESVPRNKIQGIDGIRYTDGYFADRISFEEYRQGINVARTYSLSAPAYYIRGNLIFCEPYASGPTIDIYYQRQPVAMAFLVPEVPAQTGPPIVPKVDEIPAVDCELSAEVHDLVVMLAASIGYRSKPSRDNLVLSAEYFTLALNEIDQLNLAFPPTESVTRGINRTQQDNLNDFKVRLEFQE